MRPIDRSFVVVATAYVTPPARTRRPPFHEIVLAADNEPESARYTYATRDPVVAERAIAAEGSDARFTLTTFGTLEGLRREYRILTALDPVAARGPYRRRAS